MPYGSKQRQLTGLAAWLLVSFAAAAVGAIASIEAKLFYAQLARPNWAPPSWLFGPVWSALYALMGLSAWLVWRTAGFKAAKTALALFIAQLAANALWSWLFFAWHQGAMALAEILLLWVLIAATVASFWRRSALAGALMLPYLAWVSFATALTLSVWRLNPGLL
jgi:tryptophan-rich sensory protein